MIKCMIVDDEPLARDLLESYIAELEGLELRGSCKNTQEATDLLKDQKIDLIFLDINMPKQSGIHFYKTLVHRPKVIFTTAYADYALDGFELEAIDYLLKPFSFDRFEKAVRKVDPDKGTSKQNYIMLKADKKTHKIDFDQISHFESIGDYVKAHLSDESVLIISDTLRKLERELPASIFLRIHKSYIISISQMEYIEGNQVKLPFGKIPIGQSYRDEVNNRFRK